MHLRKKIQITPKNKKCHLVILKVRKSILSLYVCVCARMCVCVCVALFISQRQSSKKRIQIPFLCVHCKQVSIQIQRHKVHFFLQTLWRQTWSNCHQVAAFICVRIAWRSIFKSRDCKGCAINANELSLTEDVAPFPPESAEWEKDYWC